MPRCLIDVDRSALPYALCACFALTVTACGGRGDERDDASESGVITTLPPMDSDPGGLRLDVGGLDTDGSPGNEECEAVEEQAMLQKQPADIIIVVDNSGSMTDEASFVQTNINGFSQQITASGIDVHVVLISSYPDDGNGICVDPPLGGGGCPDADNNAPIFNHVDEKVGSHNAWEALLDNFPNWSPTMRPDATKHIVVVTDDTSDLDPISFQTELEALDPSFLGYKHHAIIPFTDCSFAAGVEPTHYRDHTTAVGGVAGDLCLQDFQTVFDVLATEVVAGSSLSCEFDIPPPPDGEAFNPDQVNVQFDDGVGNIVTFGRVESPAECGSVVDGWFYDDPAAPTRILLCPQTCAKVQDFETASIAIQFGCATMPAG